MNYSIQFEFVNTPYLSISARKKTLKHQLYCVFDGIVLFKIGKHEYAVGPGQYFWIPANCLVSITSLPMAKYSKVELSQRLIAPFVTIPGYVSEKPIIKNALDLLRDIDLDLDYRNVLLQVIKYELLHIEPKLTITKLSQEMTLGGAKISKENNMALKLREARKSILSGKNKTTVAKEIFSMNSEEFDQFCQIILGTKL
ncbi:AraC family ligand binding domain-containing protein [Vibrio sp. TH_r3]|uniref:AraC family ligand binding domain-containing protein n=1 Tax=Vibrio sp. TH_r3 TaxID=3082084 RepID=UPI00295588A4|nr:AraC family ligand binding domain-containing protein [Vibrio sp. TH_r3]MDV7103434.1 AraC family ligand binding domain-containing protein [Vibrio sp. TH_r3]